MESRHLEFWYEFASPYCYLSALRIEQLGAAAGVAIVWRPFLLGPVFKAQGWGTSPFNVYPAKGRYMVRDIARIAAARGHAFQMPLTFPANSVAAARIALTGQNDPWGPRFSRTVFDAQFSCGADIADTAVLKGLLRSLDLDADRILEQSANDAIKPRLREQTARAEALGIFGAPSFVTPDGELFWGDDRLEQAMTWATKL